MHAKPHAPTGVAGLSTEAYRGENSGPKPTADTGLLSACCSAATLGGLLVVSVRLGSQCQMHLSPDRKERPVRPVGPNVRLILRSRSTRSPPLTVRSCPWRN